MEIIKGIYKDRLSFEQNTNGKYAIFTKFENKNCSSGFIFDSIKLLGEHQLRVSQTDAEGNTKYGAICTCGSEELWLPCVFDKIKPYEADVLQAFIGEEEYLIDRWGDVYSRKMWDIERG